MLKLENISFTVNSDEGERDILKNINLIGGFNATDKKYIKTKYL